MVSPSFATPITYTEEATASGSLNGVTFTDSDVVLSMTGDTTNAVRGISRAGSIIDSNAGTVTVSVAGFVPTTFTDRGGVFHNLGAGAIIGNVGFTAGDGTGMGPQSIVLANSLISANLYDLKTSIGPLSGPAQIVSGLSFPTVGGNFILNSVGSTATFTATTFGTVTGDPHFTTYDGLHYDFQMAGQFVLTRSTIAGNSFDVQVRTRAPFDGSAVTIVSAVAAKLGDHRVTFDLDRASVGGNFVWIDGHPMSARVDNPVLALDTGRLVKLSPEHYQVIWSTGEILDVTNAGSCLDVVSWLSPTDGAGSVEGLLGSDNGWSTDFQLADGTFLDPQISISDLYGIFADAWRVTGANSLLDDTPVPEPATITLLGIGIGLTGLGMMCRRRLGLWRRRRRDWRSKPAIGPLNCHLLGA